jgi:CheY-specific phosphatase CheX
MTAQLSQELYRAAARTFEDLAFLLPMPGDPSSAEGEQAWASVAFSGPFSGRVAVGCPTQMLVPLAANMLGDGDIPPLGQQLDALSEVANVVCGNLLPAIAGTQAIFRMEAPHVVQGDLPRQIDEPVARTHLQLHEGWAQVLLYMDAAPAGQATPT